MKRGLKSGSVVVSGARVDIASDDPGGTVPAW